MVRVRSLANKFLVNFSQNVLTVCIAAHFMASLMTRMVDFCMCLSHSNLKFDINVHQAGAAYVITVWILKH